MEQRKVIHVSSKDVKGFERAVLGIPEQTHGEDIHPSRVLADISHWIDTNQDTPLPHEADTWARLAKIAEECGEVIAAFIGYTGQNPRKGVTHTLLDVKKELLDVALTALAAYEHLDDNAGYTSMQALTNHITDTARRAGIIT